MRILELMKNLNNQAYKIEITAKSVATVILVGFLAWMIYYLSSIVVLLFASYITFAGLNPIVEKLEGNKIGNFTITKQLAIGCVFLTFLIILALISWAVVGPSYDEVLKLAENFDQLLNDSINKYGLRELLGNERFEEIQNSVVSEVANITSQLSESPQRILGLGRFLVSGLFNLITFISITFYQLTNPNKIRNLVNSFFNDKNKAKKILSEVEKKLGSWLSGQLTLMLVMGVVSYIVFSLIGIPFAFPLAIIVALFDLVPVIGPIVAYIPILIVSLALGEPWQVATVSIFYLVLQQLEGNVLVPKIMESSVGLDPILVIIALMAGGSLMGITGAILAIPFSAIIIILYQEWVEQKNISQAEFQKHSNLET
jgi:predicted PurR-regulated permease PerM